MPACQHSDQSANKTILTVIPKGTTHVFWKSIQAGANKAGKELAVRIDWIGPEKEDDRQQQIALVDNQILNQVSGIILAPIDDMALRRPVQAAVAAGIPVIIIDSGLKDSEDVYTSFIATNNYRGGQLAAAEMAKILGQNGRVIVLRFVEGSASTEERARGFLETIKDYADIQVVSDEQYGGATQSQAQQVAENLLLRFTDQSGKIIIDGIFCTNESTTYGMLQALKRKHLTGQLRFIGFDSSPALLEGLQNSEIQGLIVQNPFQMGYLGVKTMMAHLQGEPVEKVIDTGVTLVTSQNRDHPAIREILNPDIDEWLKISSD
jgi:ribose transport system substrate-binding protein